MRTACSPRPRSARRRIPLSARRPSLRQAAVALLALLCAVATPAAAEAVPVPISEGAVEWGFKASWRTYIGEAGITPSGGVTRTKDGGFAWPVAGGSYDADGSALELRLGGAVHFTAHDGLLDSRLSSGRLLISSSAAELRFDVHSKAMDGRWITLEDAPIALLDASAVTPQVADGRTTWSAIPTAITKEGAEAFTYGAGTALDPLSISYAGPGGAPDWAETWTPPGTHAYRLAESRELLPDVTWAPWIREAFVDEAAGVVHAVGYPSAAATADHLFAIDLASGAIVGDAGPLVGQRYAFDAADHTVFVGGAGGTRLTAYRWDDDAGEYAAETLSTTATGGALVYDAATETAALANSNGSVLLATRDDDGSFVTRTVAVTGLSYMGDFALDSEGGAVFTVGRGDDRVMQVDLDQPTATATAVEGLDGAAYATVAVTRAGEAWVTGLVGGLPRLQRLTRAAGGDWAPAGEPLTLPGYVASLRPSPDGARLYGIFPFGNAIHVIEDGRVRGTITTGGPRDSAENTLHVTPRADGSLYVVHPHPRLQRPSAVALPPSVDLHALDAVSPTVTEQPRGETVALGADEEERTVELTAAATGSPAPQVRWQARAGGVGRFRDLPGKTEPTLRIDATRDADGTEYRAVFANAAGEIATEPATLTVRWPPRIGQQPRSIAVVEGEDAVLKVMPLGNPHPTVTWQVRVGGFWHDLGPESGDVELSGDGGGFLTIKRTTLDQDGTRLRARVSNALGTVFSDVVELAVAPAGGAATFGSGTVEWGFAERWRCYVVGSVARGAIEVGGGVERVPGTAAGGALCPAAGAGSEALRFPVLGGSWDPAAGRLVVRLGGSVRFWGHAHHVVGDPRPQLDTSFSNLRIVVEGGRGALYADAAGATMNNPQPVTRLGVELVSLDLTGIAAAPTAGGLAWSAIPTALTAAGAEVFGSYPAGERFDPISLSLVYGTPAPEPEPQPQPQPQPEPQPQADPPVGAPAARARAATVAVAAGTRRVGPRRLARLATIRCPAGAGRCTVSAPARVRVAIAGRRYRAAVVVPRTVRPGARAALRVRLTPAAARRLRGRTATVRVRVVVRRGRAVTRRTVAARIGARRAPAAGVRAR